MVGSGDYRLEPSARSLDPLVGTVINGRFRVGRPIARGGMGRVYYGVQSSLERPVALKVVTAESGDESDAQFLKRFLVEASILAKFQHPNVVTLFDYGPVEGAAVETYFIAMEYLAGETLAERLSVRGVLPVTEALSLFHPIARGLRDVHARGILHRDLKPSNIIIVSEPGGESAKIVDFGVGKMDRIGEELTREGVLVGTPKYMAPEQFEGQSSPASDVYALGLLFYRMLAGVMPFEGSTLTEFMVQKQQPMRGLREANPHSDAPACVVELVTRMLAHDSDERPSLDEVLHVLPLCEAEVFGVRASPSRPSFPEAQLRPLPEHRTTRTLLASGLVLLSATVAMAWTVNDARRPAHPASPVASPARPSPSASSFLLHIESTPRNAVVTEGGRFLGVTPIEVTIDCASVAHGARMFFLEKDGYVSATFAQGPAVSNVDWEVVLAPELAPSVPAASVSARRPWLGTAPNGRPPGVLPTNNNKRRGELGIRLAR